MYVTAIREAMSPQGEQRITIREIQRATKSSYEHIRRVVSNGEPILSKTMNGKICKYLNLNADEMWALLQRAKSQRVMQRFGLSHEVVGSLSELKDLWPQMGPAQQQKVLDIARGFVAQNDAAIPTAPPRRRRRA